MDAQRIKELGGAFFEKYKKTEGDRTAWSAPFTTYGTGGTFEINFTQCPRGDVFKIFANNQKVEEIIGWEQFLAALPGYEQRYPDLFSIDAFFNDLATMI